MGNLFFIWQVCSLKLPRIVYCLLRKLTLPEQKVQFPVFVFQLSMLLFCSLHLHWWNGSINLKFLSVYVQRGYHFCTDQQRIYHILLLLLSHPKQLYHFSNCENWTRWRWWHRVRHYVIECNVLLKFFFSWKRQNYKNLINAFLF